MDSWSFSQKTVNEGTTENYARQSHAGEKGFAAAPMRKGRAIPVDHRIQGLRGSPHTGFAATMNNETSNTPTKADVSVQSSIKAEAERLLGESQSMADFLYRIHYKNVDEQIDSMLRAAGKEPWSLFARLCQPWPEWVLRTAVEVLSVRMPSVSKDTIFSALRWLHFFVLEARPSGPKPRESAPPFRPDAKLCGAVAGHVAAWTERWMMEIENVIADGSLPREKRDQFSQQFSREKNQEEFASLATRYIEARPAEVISFSASLGHAAATTFDKMGNPKDTTLTQIYVEILSQWPMVEKLAGPTALAEYLQPVLKGSENDPDKRLDRVKKICRRMGIQFKPVVKGQALTQPVPAA